MAVSVKQVLARQLERGNKEKLIARLSRNLVRSGQCWIWTGAKDHDGYPKMNFRHDGKHVQVYVHRVFFVLREGRDPSEGMELDHKCQNPACVWCTQEITVTKNRQLVHERKKQRTQAAA